MRATTSRHGRHGGITEIDGDRQGATGCLPCAGDANAFGNHPVAGRGGREGWGEKLRLSSAIWLARLIGVKNWDV